MKTLSNPYEPYTFRKLELITSSDQCRAFALDILDRDTDRSGYSVLRASKRAISQGLGGGLAFLRTCSGTCRPYMHLKGLIAICTDDYGVRARFGSHGRHMWLARDLLTAAETRVRM